ncbi:DUF159 family protein [Novosphingobium endophyticum]|uniref:Abasic site processing protein n=1 Tax=Novosphingobium endophyticum TaxID=1955250 RepID=A0A916X600_9SPHN|nr:SOS response-associated peptidase family protein [Novosphingobium endophyticum]GGC04976.1 DUF159 family protein [Novosphingobium endophyticum]
MRAPAPGCYPGLRDKRSTGRICNLYRLTSPAEAVGALFRAEVAGGINHASQIYPGYKGLVLAGGAVRAMTWGFPLAVIGRGGVRGRPRPVNNARSDRLASPFWKSSFEHRRCLIPLSAFAEAQGPKGCKTRTWISLPGEPLFACAGLWRESEEWGPVYAMVMTDAALATAQVHERMPVIVPPQAHGQWMRGSSAEALALCEPWTRAVTIDRTDEPWAGRA